MFKLLKALKVMREVFVTAGAVLAAVVIAIETYQALRKTIRGRQAS